MKLTEDEISIVFIMLQDKIVESNNSPQAWKKLLKKMDEYLHNK